VDRLRRLGVLGEGSSVAHCVWVTEDEVAAIASSGATVVHNPISNLRTGTGLAPLRALRRSGAGLALGSDGAVVNEGLDMFQAMKVAALVHKLSGSLDDAPSAALVLDACQHGGARACGLGRCTLDRGDRADVIVLRGESLAGGEHAQLLNELVYGAAGREVATVLVAGRPVVEDGVPTAAGWSETRRWGLKRRAERARAAAQGQRSRLAGALREIASSARAERGASAFLDPLGGHR
jgi:guanine deaminase